MSLDDLLSPDQVAALCNVKPQTLEVWRARRKGPPWLKLSKTCIRYPRKAFEAWAEAQLCDPAKMRNSRKGKVL